MDRSRAPTVLKMLAHDIRWRLVEELRRSDRRVQELVERVGEPQNLVSYHLGQLRRAGLVSERRSSADARDVYYSLDVDRFRQAMTSAASAVRLGLVTGLVETALQAGRRRKPRVLFLCTHNSARSQMAEGLLRARSQDRVHVASAGSQPTQLHPLAIETTDELEIDIRTQRAKHVDDLRGQRFDFVITLCDSIREVCPPFAGSPELIHWSLRDPVEGEPAAMRSAFRATAQELEKRIRSLVLLLNEWSVADA